MTNPVGTKEQREEIRRKTRDHSAGWWRKQALEMADGLDNAQEMAAAARKLADHMHYDYDANCPLADGVLRSLAEWDKWVGGLDKR